MTSHVPHNGAPQALRLADIPTTLIGSGAIAAEMALLAPPAPRFENGSRPPRGAEPLRTIGGGRRLRTIGGGR